MGRLTSIWKEKLNATANRGGGSWFKSKSRQQRQWQRIGLQFLTLLQTVLHINPANLRTSVRPALLDYTHCARSHHLEYNLVSKVTKLYNVGSCHSFLPVLVGFALWIFGAVRRLMYGVHAFFY